MGNLLKTFFEEKEEERQRADVSFDRDEKAFSALFSSVRDTSADYYSRASGTRSRGNPFNASLTEKRGR